MDKLKKMYIPKKYDKKVVDKGEFVFAAVGLDHGHIYGMCDGLIQAGAELSFVYDPDQEKIKKFTEKYPNVRVCTSLTEVLENPNVHMIASASIPSERITIGLKTLDNNKHFFSAKPGFIEDKQLNKARSKVKETNLKWGIYYNERLHVESAIFAGELIEAGAIGEVVQVIGTGPHRANIDTRPDWFFEPEQYGGILCDIGSHQIEQFLHYTKANDAKVLHSKVGNYAFSNYPGLQDFGDATLLADNGTTFYFRVDWLTPDGLGTWGDGRTLILGTEGYIELRKYIDVARSSATDNLYLVNNMGESHFELSNKVGFPFFGEFILDCLNGTENAMSQQHAFKTAELSIEAQEKSMHIQHSMNSKNT